MSGGSDNLSPLESAHCGGLSPCPILLPLHCVSVIMDSSTPPPPNNNGPTRAVQQQRRNTKSSPPLVQPMTTIGTTTCRVAATIHHLSNRHHKANCRSAPSCCPLLRLCDCKLFDTTAAGQQRPGNYGATTTAQQRRHLLPSSDQ